MKCSKYLSVPVLGEAGRFGGGQEVNLGYVEEVREKFFSEDCPFSRELEKRGKGPFDATAEDARSICGSCIAQTRGQLQENTSLLLELID